MTTARKDVIHTRIWDEDAMPDNPFVARAARCRGYDVFGALVGNARWIEMLALQFRDELPTPTQLQALEALAVALANPGPRDPSVHAAMCGAVGGSAAAASLIAALSVGAGRVGGAREVFDAMEMWQQYGRSPAAWLAWPQEYEPVGPWPAREHVPGCDPHGVSTPLPINQLLAAVSDAGETTRWLRDHTEEVLAIVGRPVALTAVAAAVFLDLGYTASEGEMLFLLLRLPGAAAHALEQTGNLKGFPFYRIELDQP